MTKAQDQKLAAQLLTLVAQDGLPIGNQALRKQLAQALGRVVNESEYKAALDALVAQGLLETGKGRGGSVRRVQAVAGEFQLAEQQAPANNPAVQSGKAVKTGKPVPRAKSGDNAQVISYRHADRRRNNPEVGMVTPDTDPAQPQTAWAYDPHLDPALQFDIGRAQIETLIDGALESGDDARMRAALQELKRLQQPYLNWSGKAERTSFEVETVSLHVHERIDPASILSAVRKNMKNPSPRGRGEGVRAGGNDAYTHQPDLFAAPFENLPLRDAIDFYRHERGWANRLIAGDSLLVMNSLLQKESMAGQVQMIYLDPPYGIKYGSNFQPFVNKRDVKDRKDEDLTQEPEMIKAFRDTWELGIHSYLTYLRDRLLLAKELLHESGSVFVQISDENVHRVRDLMDDVFGPDNFCSQIVFRKTTGKASGLLDATCDFLIWYAKNRRAVKYRPLNESRSAQDDYNLRYVELPSGATRTLAEEEIFGLKPLPSSARIFRPNPVTSARPPQDGDVRSFEFRGREFSSGQRTFSTDRSGLTRLSKAGRLTASGNTLGYIRYLDDFPFKPSNDIWDDTRQSGFGEAKVYVVQTSQRAVERCLLMTTDPGDLVLDPTCGSGTTAFVAEKWGRRWITCDTSRVSVTLAKQRLMTASYDYYELKYPQEGLKSGFIYKTVPHVTLKSIANNPEIDEIYERMHPAIEAALADLNKAIVGWADDRKPNKSADNPVGLRSSAQPTNALQEWEVPFDFPADWPEAARKPFDAFHAARQAMQKKMDDSIAAHADQETLYDQPAVSKNKLRITGPFTVEAVPFPTVLALETLTPSPLPGGEGRYPMEADVAIARSGESARQHSWRDELLKTGIRGKGGQMLKFADLETLPDSPHLHVSGHLDSGERVVVSFGPEHAALEQRQVAMALNEAEKLRPAPKFIIFASFEFDPEAAKDIDETKWPGVTLLKAKMNADLLTDDLKKGRASNQSFWLMGQPDVEVHKLPSPPKALTPGPSPAGRGEWYQVEVHGFDYFDTAKGELVSGGKGKIAMWLLDTDYDERSLFPRQVFFPMAGKGEGWEKLKKDIRAELNEALLEKFHGTKSLPFAAGENRKVAVKIVDDRGIESLKIIPLES